MYYAIDHVERVETWNNCSHTLACQENNIKATLNIAGALLVLLGAVWFLQGINVLPGSFMTGQIRWAIYGGIAVLAGVSLLWAAKIRRNGGR